MFTMRDFINHVSQTPDSFYRELNQATIDTSWDNTTQIRMIKEENYPFDNTFKDEEVWVSTVADVTTSTNKVVGNYINVLFKDIKHKLNHRGQKYIYKTDGENEDFYLCYDKLNPITHTANTKLILCNNKLKWIDRDNGALREEPMFIGWELTSTNNQISKDGIVPERRLVCLVQGNEYTRKIIDNQRFILSHNKAFKITQVDDLNLEHLDETIPTLLTLYIQWCPILPVDNLAENIANYYDGKFTIETNLKEINGENGDIGTISTIVKYNDDVVSIPLDWSSSDESVVTVDQNGRYKIVGLSGTQATIKVCISGNESICEEVVITVGSGESYNLSIIPNGEIDIYKGETEKISFELYLNSSVKPDQVINYNVIQGVSGTYKIDEFNNFIEVHNLKSSNKQLIIEFNTTIPGGEILSETVTINLLGLF